MSGNISNVGATALHNAYASRTSRAEQKMNLNFINELTEKISVTTQEILKAGGTKKMVIEELRRIETQLLINASPKQQLIIRSCIQRHINSYKD